MARSPLHLAKLRRTLPQGERWRLEAELLGLSKTARLRLEWMIFYESMANRNASVTAAYFGISRQTFHVWRSRFAGGRLRHLENRPTVARARRSWRPDPEVLERMLALRRRYPDWGKETLAAAYEAQYGERISAWQFQQMIRVFRMARTSRKRKPRRQSDTAKARISYAVRRAQAQLWQLDTVVLPMGRSRRFAVTAVEHASKLGYARVYESANSVTAYDFLSRLQWVVDADIRVVLTDNGSEFAGTFARVCAAQGVTRYYSRPRRPTDNPEVERFNQTLRTEWLDRGGEDADIRRMNRTLAGWLTTYNTVRPHHAIGLLTPLVVAQAADTLSTSAAAQLAERLARQ